MVRWGPLFTYVNHLKLAWCIKHKKEDKKSSWKPHNKFKISLNLTKVLGVRQSAHLPLKQRKIETIWASPIWDLFGSILFLCKVGITEVFSYPPTPVPLSLSYADGTILKTKKSPLLSALETKVATIPPVNDRNSHRCIFFPVFAA